MNKSFPHFYTNKKHNRQFQCQSKNLPMSVRVLSKGCKETQHSYTGFMGYDGKCVYRT